MAGCQEGGAQQQAGHTELRHEQQRYECRASDEDPTGHLEADPWERG
jgi:hypothetical protein